MNQSQGGYTYTRGWGVPFLGIVMGVALVLGAGWVVLSSLFAQVGTSAAAAIVMIAGSCGIGGVVLALVVAWLLQLIRAERVQVQAAPPASYDVLPAVRRPPVLLPASNALARYQSAPMASDTVELRMADGHGEVVPIAAIEAILAMNPVRRPKGWPFANSAYTWGKRWAVENRYLHAEDGKSGEWIDRDKMRQVVRAWTGR